MYIAIIADDHKKELMAQFCIAYRNILAKHKLCATHITGKYISEATGLDIETYLAGDSGGLEQITSRISYNEIDLVFCFRSIFYDEMTENEYNLVRMCDEYTIPLATNIATAEALITALDNGLLNWREYVNPNSEHNKKKRQK